MARKNLFGPAPARKRRRTAQPRPQTPQRRLIGKLGGGRGKRKIPTAVGPGPDPALAELFDGARDLGECGRRLAQARPELGEAERLGLLRTFVTAINTRWLDGTKRPERRRAIGHAPGEEVDFLAPDC